jgi:hypothetical protein
MGGLSGLQVDGIRQEDGDYHVRIGQSHQDTPPPHIIGGMRGRQAKEGPDSDADSQ